MWAFWLSHLTPLHFLTVITSFEFLSFFILPLSLLPTSLYSWGGSWECAVGELGLKLGGFCRWTAASHLNYTQSHLTSAYNFSYFSKHVAFCLCIYLHSDWVVISLSVKYTQGLIFLIYKIVSKVASITIIFTLLAF